MDFLFPVSGVEAPLWLPPLVALVISFFTSMAGVSGAFLLLPFQMSVLGFVTPAVSATNMVFNITAIPGGVYRYLREGRMVWPLVVTVVVGTLPGVLIGVLLRVSVLSDPRPFKAFVGCILLYVGIRLVLDVGQTLKKARTAEPDVESDDDAQEQGWRTETLSFTWRRLAIRFRGKAHSCSTIGIGSFSFLVGIISGAYGIGGGAIVAPVFVALYGLPVYAVAGATLLGTFITSIVGVLMYQGLASFSAAGGPPMGPDWLLGALFGLGGLVGMYLGARVQKHVSSNWLKLMLGLIVFFVAIRYVVGYVLA